MALWQYTFIIIPNEFADCEITPDEFGGYETAPFWFHANVSEDILNEIENILPLGESWNEKLTVYGNTDSNCIEIFRDGNGTIDSVSFRIDFYSDYDHILEEFVTFCRSNDFAIIDEKLNVIDLDTDRIKKIIENSPQKALYEKLATNE